MNGFDCLTIYTTSGGYGLHISSTNEDTLGRIRDLIAEKRPSCEISSRTQLACGFKISGYQPLEVGWWLVQQLCHRGWEPFGNVRWEEAWGLEFISLRRDNAQDSNE
jgi:hypothetical protein